MIECPGWLAYTPGIWQLLAVDRHGTAMRRTPRPQTPDRASAP